MTQLNLLDTARQRAQTSQLPYGGALTPAEAYALLQSNSSVKLVDVRTRAERDWVGVVQIPAEQHLAVQWNLYPDGKPNPKFLEELAAVAGKDDVLLFLCRSGVRSKHAAKLATEQGYANSFDIVEGFEGNKDSSGHRKTIEGWCKANLPWIGA